MYLLLGLLLVICLLFLLLTFYRRKRIVCKVHCMDLCEKLELLNDLAEPFGFCYSPKQDLMTSRVDAFQREFGYCSLYDKSALHFNMVLDCEPIYFEYGNRTWMIELWKGQYGINIGAEIGVYYTDTVLQPEQYEKTLFHAVKDEEMLPFSMSLNYKGQLLFSISRAHWWLTGFRMGSYCNPEDLVLDVSITFPSEEMKMAFVESLCRTGYGQCEINICRDTVSFSFSTPHTRQPRFCHCRSAAFSQWKNRILLGIYQLATRPFLCTMDQILYLYFYLPAAFRRMLRFRKNRKQKLPGRSRRKIKREKQNKGCKCR